MGRKRYSVWVNGTAIANFQATSQPLKVLSTYAGKSSTTLANICSNNEIEGYTCRHPNSLARVGDNVVVQQRYPWNVLLRARDGISRP